MAKKKKRAGTDEEPVKNAEETAEETAAEAGEEAAEEAGAVEPEVIEADETDEKDKKIEELNAELAQSKEKYMRLAAEYDNFRKRTANEKLSLYDDATSKAVKELLPVADSVRMALENLKDADPEIIKGVELISGQLDKSFEKLKIESYGEAGDEFDPNLHNAVSMVESEEFDSGKIAAVFQTGYKIGDKIIRHAMVQVVS